MKARCAACDSVSAVVRARGLCQPCYDRQRYLANRERVCERARLRRWKPPQPVKICVECKTEKVSAKGLCRRCYSRYRYYVVNTDVEKRRADARRLRDANPERVRESARRGMAKYRAKHAERVRDYTRRRYAGDPTQFPARTCSECLETTTKPMASGLCHNCYSRRYRAAHKDHVRAMERKYRAALHPDELALRARRRYEKNPAHFCELMRRARKAKPWLTVAAHARRRARIAGVINDLTKEQWDNVVAAHNGRCHYEPWTVCGSNGRIEQEHMIPLCRGGGHTAANIVPACRRCNSRKRARTKDEFIEWLARLAARREALRDVQR